MNQPSFAELLKNAKETENLPLAYATLATDYNKLQQENKAIRTLYDILGRDRNKWRERALSSEGRIEKAILQCDDAIEDCKMNFQTRSAERIEKIKATLEDKGKEGM